MFNSVRTSRLQTDVLVLQSRRGEREQEYQTCASYNKLDIALFGNFLYDAHSLNQCILPLVNSVFIYHLPGWRLFSCRFNFSAKNCWISFLKCGFETGCTLFQIVKSSSGLNDKTRRRDSFFDPTSPLDQLGGLLPPPSAPFYPFQLLVFYVGYVKYLVTKCKTLRAGISAIFPSCVRYCSIIYQAEELLPVVSILLPKMDGFRSLKVAFYARSSVFQIF